MLKGTNSERRERKKKRNMERKSSQFKQIFCKENPWNSLDEEHQREAFKFSTFAARLKINLFKSDRNNEPQFKELMHITDIWGHPSRKGYY